MDLTLHGTDEQLEYYALGRLADAEVPVLEEHLMVCAACRDRLDRFETFALGIQQALSEPAPQPSMSALAKWFRRPAFGLAFAGAAFAAIALYYAGTGSKSIPAASLQLMAIRGDMPFVHQAPETDLTLADAPAGGPYRVELVDGAGNALWNTVASGAAGGIVVKVQRQFRPGDYFVRLYSPSREVIHEYGFRVRN